MGRAAQHQASQQGAKAPRQPAHRSFRRLHGDPLHTTSSNRSASKNRAVTRLPGRLAPKRDDRGSGPSLSASLVRPKTAVEGPAEGTTMFHPSTQRLIDYWRDRKGDAPAPSRSDINPGDFTDLLPQVFIVGREKLGRMPFRLTGGFLTDLHARDLRGEDLLSLWAL
ncbi:MAG TPA: PAS domain-containing protein, partial [Caulobacter sp.]|nr:PAS domain-containing protein [Caulobacter sp.]